MTNAWGGLTAEYLTSLRAADKRPATLRQHAHYLRHLARYARSPLALWWASWRLPGAPAVPLGEHVFLELSS